jgi:hypothetical protein
MLEEIKSIKSGRKELREFGLTIGVILAGIGAFALWRHKGAVALYLLGVGALFILLGMTLPGILKPPQKAWMTLSLVLGFFISRIILFILFCVVLTPIGLIARIVDKDMLNQRLEPHRTSYWYDKETKVPSKESYENQY